MIAYHLLITMITVIMAMTSQQPMTPDPAHVAGVCRGEASFAIEECACSVQNRIQEGWSRERVMSAYYAPWVQPTEAEVDAVAAILAGKSTCDPDLYYMLEPASVAYLGMSHIEPAAVIKSPDGRRQISFFPRKAWREETMTSKNNHLQLGATDSGGMAFICLHCGTIVLPLMPITFPDMDQRNDKFLQEHSNCPCPESGPHDGLRLLVKAGLRTPP